MIARHGPLAIWRHVAGLLALTVVVAGLRPVLAEQAHAEPARPADAVTVFTNVRLFDGKGGALSAPTSVTVRGHLIERIGAPSPGLPP